jgi:hypothetical protein
MLSDVAIIAGLVSSVIASALALVGVVRTRIKEAIEKGRVEQLREEMQKDLDAAHAKIRNLEGGVQVIDQTQSTITVRLSSIAETQTRHEHNIQKLQYMHMDERK